jgi:O-antigen ligase
VAKKNHKNYSPRVFATQLTNQTWKHTDMISPILIGACLLNPFLLFPIRVFLASPVISDSPEFTTGYRFDPFFSQFIFLITVTVVIATCFIKKVLNDKSALSHDYLLPPIFIMFFTVILSSLFSKYKTAALFGELYLNQGTIAYACYLILFFIIVKSSLSVKNLNYFFNSLIPTVCLLDFWALNAFYGIGANFPSLNANHISGLASVMTIMFLSKSLLTTKKKDRYICLFTSILSLVAVFTSMSTGGFLTMLLVLPLVLGFVLMYTRFKQSLYTMAAFILAFLVLFAVFNFHNSQVWNESFGFFGGSVNSSFSVSNAVISSSPSEVNVDSEFNLPKPGWSAGTGRTYIWKRTVELIKVKPLLGYGLDTLAYFFPQNDLEKLSNLAGNVHGTVDKPHNLYLGIAFGSGLISLGAFIVLICTFIVRFFQFLLKNLLVDNPDLVASLFLGFCAFLVQFLVNDSSLMTSLIFWVLFGLCVGILPKSTSGDI